MAGCGHSAVEAPPSFGVLQEQGAWGEALGTAWAADNGLGGAQLAQACGDLGGAAAVGVAHQSAGEGGEARAHDSGQVQFRRAGDDIFLQATSALGDHGEHQAIDNGLIREGWGLTAALEYRQVRGQGGTGGR